MPHFKRFNSNRTQFINPSKYLVNWTGKTRSKFQTAVKEWFRPFWEKHLCLEEMPVPGTRMKCDLVNLTKKIIVETSGAQHLEYNEHFHQGNRWNFLKQFKRDEDKRTWAEQNGFIFIEIYPEDMPLTKEFFLRYNLSF